MVAGSFTCESLSPVAPERLWKAHFFDVHNLAPKALPHIFSSVVILEGDGGVGTVKQFNFSDAIKDLKYWKDRIDAVDHENYTFKYTVFEGGLIGKTLRTFTVETKYEPTSGGGSKIRSKVDYDTLGGELLSDKEEGELKGGIMTLSDTLAGHLKANPNAYA